MTPKPKEGTLRVWWIRNPPNSAHGAQYISVKNIEEAKLVLCVLSETDLFLGDDIVSVNAGSLEIFEDGEWSEYYDNEGRNIDDMINDREAL